MATVENNMINIILLDQDKWISEGIKHLINKDEVYAINCVNKIPQINNFIQNDTKNIIIFELVIENTNIPDILRSIQLLCMKKSDVSPIILTRIEDAAMIGFINHHYPDLPVITKSENTSFIQDFIFNYMESLIKRRGNKINNNYLTTQDMLLMKWLATGNKHKNAPTTLNLSERKISWHKNNIMRKLNCKNHKELYLKLIDYGYLAPLH